MLYIIYGYFNDSEHLFKVYATDEKTCLWVISQIEKYCKEVTYSELSEQEFLDGNLDLNRLTPSSTHGTI